MKLNDIENKIKYLIDQDINNPEIYNYIVELSIYFLKRRRLISPSIPLEEVAHLMAEELYMRVLNGTKIDAWMGYMSKSYLQAIRIWKKMFSREFIEVGNDIELKDAIVDMYISEDSIDAFDRVEEKGYLTEIVNQIDTVMGASRYSEFTKDYINARLSLIISLTHGEFYGYNLVETEKEYVIGLYNILCRTIRNNISYICKGIDPLQHLSLTQILSLEEKAKNEY